jgi:hypothetical protein
MPVMASDETLSLVKEKLYQFVKPHGDFVAPSSQYVNQVKKNIYLT